MGQPNIRGFWKGSISAELPQAPPARAGYAAAAPLRQHAARGTPVQRREDRSGGGTATDRSSASSTRAYVHTLAAIRPDEGRTVLASLRSPRPITPALRRPAPRIDRAATLRPVPSRRPCAHPSRRCCPAFAQTPPWPRTRGLLGRRCSPWRPQPPAARRAHLGAGTSWRARRHGRLGARPGAAQQRDERQQRRHAEKAPKPRARHGAPKRSS